MPELTIVLLSNGTSRNFAKAEVRLGRDPGCDLVFASEEFPMVGRHHAVLRETGGAWSVEDLQSTNGTFVNQVRVQRLDLVPGDTLRLGSDGPELRVQFFDERGLQSTRPAAFAAAAGVVPKQPSAARSSDLPPRHAAELNATPATAGAQIAPSPLPPTRLAVPPTAPAMRPAKPTTAPHDASPATIHVRQEEEAAQPELSSAVAAPQQQAEISEQEEEDPMNDEKLTLLRNLVFVMVALVLVLAGIVISQTQDIRRDLRGLHDEAANALTQSKLNERMQGMEAAVNGMDKKIQDAQQDFSQTMDQKMQDAQKKFSNEIHQSMTQEEDHLMNRVKQELPQILDQEIERQKRKVMQ